MASNQAISFAQLTRDTFTLLSPEQRQRALRNVGSSLLQALLEVISITAVIPVLLAFLQQESLEFLKIPVSTTLNWQTLLGIIILIFIVKNALSLVLTHYQFRFVHDVFIALSQQRYENFYKQSYTDYTNQNSADTVRKIKHTPSDFSNYVLQGYLNLITDAVICVLMTSVLLFYNFEIVFIIAVLCAPIILFYYWYRTKILAQVNKSFRELTPLGNVVITQGIDSFAEAKIYRRESFFIRHFMHFNRITSLHLANLKSAANIPSRLFEVVGILSLATVVGYAKMFSFEDHQLITLIGLLSLAMYRLIPSLNRILTSLSQIQAYGYSVTELKETFNPDREASANLAQDLRFKQSMLFENISFRYDRNSTRHVLRNLTMTINKGEFTVMEGPSGSGKTTFLHILAGLIIDFEGTIYIDDVALSAETMSSWQRKISFVPQSPIVLQDTILYNVAFGQEESDVNTGDVEAALQSAGLYDFVMKMPHGIRSHVGENGMTLSGGQRQRLILARALYRKPQVLLLDEVTNQLDHENKVRILATLKTLTDSGITIILASHDPLVREFASRIVTLNGMTSSTIQRP
jgi:ATP-binding cassette, subfamily B, bacterial PglK